MRLNLVLAHVGATKTFFALTWRHEPGMHLAELRAFGAMDPFGMIEVDGRLMNTYGFNLHTLVL